MENVTHTSGPFAISRNATPDYAPQYSIYAESGNGNDIAIVKGDNAERDAALFAAAPDMLAALEAFIECDGLRPGHVAYRSKANLIMQAKQAIAKATPSPIR